MDKPEAARVLNTLRKLRQMTWAQVYRDSGLKWEKIDSVKPPKGIDAIYSLSISLKRAEPLDTARRISCASLLYSQTTTQRNGKK